MLSFALIYCFLLSLKGSMSNPSHQLLQDSLDQVAEMLAEKLFNRATKQSPIDDADMNEVTLDKPSPQIRHVADIAARAPFRSFPVPRSRHILNAHSLSDHSEAPASSVRASAALAAAALQYPIASEDAEPSFPIKAVCECGPNGKPCEGGSDDGNKCRGTVHLTQLDKDKCQIEYEIKGLTPGKHGFHIHQKADFSNGCMSAGPHFNPFGKTHGNNVDEERHVGDLGNIVAGDDGVSKGTITDHLVKLYGDSSVIGRSIMVHADEDDLGLGDNSRFGEKPPPNGFVSKETGNAGARIACGEIKLCCRQVN
eukprot:gnl/MRDRNA2_/MRDRNA2_120823_c0_seq1.p1 gnl/MRDRNA2_/MRDRNA2_120823_c0~~gnl/MRDRNA2_/MRDRNA2_120823_c0_seq1.p1  ORF type:complete len:311 (+),score=55.80 gnl/MRDRNA2_/MRDRNA2_120823_c0_seq1:59-991(+)